MAERTLADDLIFSSPLDVGLDRDGYFERCWAGAGQRQEFEFVRVVESGDEVIVTYEARKPDGSRGRNTEVLTFDGDQVARVEVYFGWNVDGAGLAERFTISMLMMHLGTPRDQEAREHLAAALPDAAVREPDETGAFDVVVAADDLEHALTRVWDAVSASGTDDHIVFLEHPELPEHWKPRSRPPGR